MKTAKDVDSYIKSAPKEAQPKLKEVRAAIKAAAPQAAEKISYGMPYYHYNGRLAYFSIAKKHIGLYIPTPVVAEHKKELEGFYAEGATIRFPFDKKLPIALVKKLVKARAKKNDAAKKLK
jgi:uncharacterized protein YdhG (YjbR/CyaY superfamily)